MPQKHGSQVCFCTTTLCCGYHFPAVSSFPCTPEFLSLFLLHLHNSLGQETLTLHCSNCPFRKQDGGLYCGQRERPKTIFWLPVSYIRSSECIQRSFAHCIYTLSRAIKVYHHTVPTFRCKPIHYCHRGQPYISVVIVRWCMGMYIVPHMFNDTCSNYPELVGGCRLVQAHWIAMEPSCCALWCHRAPTKFKWHQFPSPSIDHKSLEQRPTQPPSSFSGSSHFLLQGKWMSRL